MCDDCDQNCFNPTAGSDTPESTTAPNCGVKMDCKGKADGWYPNPSNCRYSIHPLNDSLRYVPSPTPVQLQITTPLSLRQSTPPNAVEHSRGLLLSTPPNAVEQRGFKKLLKLAQREFQVKIDNLIFSSFPIHFAYSYVMQSCWRTPMSCSHAVMFFSSFLSCRLKIRRCKFRIM